MLTRKHTDEDYDRNPIPVSNRSERGVRTPDDNVIRNVRVTNEFT